MKLLFFFLFKTLDITENKLFKVKVYIFEKYLNLQYEK